MTAPVEPSDDNQIIAATRTLLPAAAQPWPGGYPDQIELALIDAILSMRTRYAQPHNGARGQVRLWRDHRAGNADDLAFLATSNLATVLTNPQRISGVPKVDVIRAAAAALHTAGITTAADLLADPRTARAAYCSVRGLSSVTFDYLCMLIGIDTVKPDTWILRYLHQVLDRDVTPPRHPG